VSSILTPGSFAWMNSEGSGLGLQIQGGLTSQWFESTFCASLFAAGPVDKKSTQCCSEALLHVGLEPTTFGS
jgi:hypothetical protein